MYDSTSLKRMGIEPVYTNSEELINQLFQCLKGDCPSLFHCCISAGFGEMPEAFQKKGIEGTLTRQGNMIGSSRGVAPVRVWGLTRSDMRNLSSSGYSNFFVPQFVVVKDDEFYGFGTQIRYVKNGNLYSCYFMKELLCGVQENKPVGCRIYPYEFLPFVDSKARKAYFLDVFPDRERCPGVGKGEVMPEEKRREVLKISVEQAKVNEELYKMMGEFEGRIFFLDPRLEMSDIEFSKLITI